MTRARLAIAGWVALFAAYLAARVVILLGGKVYTSYDSFSYAYRNDPRWDRGALVSFTGHAPRSWGVPLFFVMFGDDHSRAVGQWVISTIAWAMLALALSAYFRQPVRPFVAAAILLIGLLRPVSSWDFAILSESLSISLGVIALAAFLFWLRRNSIVWLVVMLVAGVWWTFTRSDMFPMVLPFAAAFAFLAWRRRREPDTRMQPIAGMLVLLIAAGWAYAITPATFQTFQRWSFAPQLGQERGMLMYRLRISVFPDPEVKSFFQHEFGMPACAGADRVAAEPEWAVDDFAAAVDKCPEMKAWADTNAHGMWKRYATKNPTLFARQVEQSTSDALSGAAYADTPQVLPGIVERAAFPRSHALVITLGLTALSLALALAAGAWRRQRRLVLIALAVAATALASAVLTVVVSSGEVWRFGIQEAIAFRIAIVMLLACAAEGLADRLSAKRSH
jgi:hypothetical protein